MRTAVQTVRVVRFSAMAAAMVGFAAVSAGCYEKVVRTRGITSDGYDVYQRSDEKQKTDLFGNPIEPEKRKRK